MGWLSKRRDRHVEALTPVAIDRLLIRSGEQSRYYRVHLEPSPSEDLDRLEKISAERRIRLQASLG